ncbi:Carboxypeptidase [Mycena chlorophos]|uniref:Carboxypeptidase n=1 Tax=Mycena chlorophos TaxID=658473 RepID=A0A8H6SE91_MYCCL|nr:Carboxypeptidase [Mycena chlorophos]
MKVAGFLVPLLSLSLSWASPTGEQVVLSLGQTRLPTNDVLNAVNDLLSDATKAILHGKKNLQKWWHDGRQFIKQDELLYELVEHPVFQEHQLRVTEPTTLCDPGVKQYSGYLDIAEDKHLFFWFFESRNSPSSDPLVLWLNGGPGCSSSTGLLFELGPCAIANDGNNITHNPHSWNSNANMIFLDQPVNVGFSYADEGTSVNNSPLAGKDVHAFLQLFLQRFPEYSKQPFHISGESYGGTFIPHIGSAIWQANLQLAAAPNPSLKKINLASLLIGNGLTDPYTQMGTVAEYACEGPYPIYDDPEGPQCQALKSKIPTCQRMIKSCYNFDSKFTCVPALLYCNSQLFGPLQQTGINLYDVRKKCDRATDGDLCYRQMNWIDTWMNTPANKVAIGANPSLTFASCNMEVNQAFAFQGDGGHNSAKLLPELIEGGVRLLIYAGLADAMCNAIGNEKWLEVLENKFQSEYVAAKPKPWVTASKGDVVGTVRAAGGNGFTAGNVTFVQVFEAGHMVPYDQPEAALDMFTRWISDVPLS